MLLILGVVNAERCSTEQLLKIDMYEMSERGGKAAFFFHSSEIDLPLPADLE